MMSASEQAVSGSSTRLDFDAESIGHLRRECGPVLTPAAEYVGLRQFSDLRNGRELRSSLVAAANNRSHSCVLASQVFGRNPAGGSGAELPQAASINYRVKLTSALAIKTYDELRSGRPGCVRLETRYDPAARLPRP